VICAETPGCQRPAGHIEHYPCGGALRQLGDPCEFCGDPLPANEGGGATFCPRCWTPITIADAKAIFTEVGLTVDLRPATEETP
jgi:hypothetical protein